MVMGVVVIVVVTVITVVLVKGVVAGGTDSSNERVIFVV